MYVFDSPGQGWTQLTELAIAFGLSALIGMEREYRQKSAGLRTYTVVGTAAALIMLVSKYGFFDVLQSGRIVLDPSRVAAQIVTGIGFIGGGVIFMRRDLVRGLTTAAIVWLTAAVGMACGAGLPILAIAVTAGHFIIVLVFPALARRLPHGRMSVTLVRLVYENGKGVLRKSLADCTRLGFSVSDVSIRPSDSRDDVATVDLGLIGFRDLTALTERLRSIDGALAVHIIDPEDASGQGLDAGPQREASD